jgi:hypothetical protein
MIVVTALACGFLPYQTLAANPVLGCAKWGNRMTLPAGWFVINPCTDHGGGFSPRNQSMLIGVDIELHNWWNDARSRASIAADIKYNSTLTGPLTWLTPEIHGTRWLLGAAPTRDDSGGKLYVQIELETFIRRHLYKISALYEKTADTKANLKMQRALLDAIDTMVVTGVPDGMPTPGKHPLPTPAPIPTTPPLSDDTYKQVSDHPDEYVGDTVRWTCVIAKFFGVEPSTGDQIVGCWEYTGQWQGGIGDGEAILRVSVTSGIDLTSMASGDSVVVIGRVEDPYQGTNGYGAAMSWPQLDVLSITDTGLAATS